MWRYLGHLHSVIKIPIRIPLFHFWSSFCLRLQMTVQAHRFVLLSWLPASAQSSQDFVDIWGMNQKRKFSVSLPCGLSNKLKTKNRDFDNIREMKREYTNEKQCKKVTLKLQREKKSQQWLIKKKNPRNFIIEAIKNFQRHGDPQHWDW